MLDPAVDRVDKVARELTEGRGADFAFDAVGRGSVVESLLKATRNGGTTVMVGIPSTEDVVNVRALLHAFYEKKLVGCYLGSADPQVDFPRILDLWRAGRLDLDSMVTRIRPLAEINDAVADLRAGTGVRTVLEMRRDEDGVRQRLRRRRLGPRRPRPAHARRPGDRGAVRRPRAGRSCDVDAAVAAARAALPAGRRSTGSPSCVARGR